MALNLKSADADRLARELAAMTGESLTEAVTTALAERIARCRVQQLKPGLAAELAAIRRRASKLKWRDKRPIDEILGYGPDGTFDR